MSFLKTNVLPRSSYSFSRIWRQLDGIREVCDCQAVVLLFPVNERTVGIIFRQGGIKPNRLVEVVQSAATTILRR